MNCVYGNNNCNLIGIDENLFGLFDALGSVPFYLCVQFDRYGQLNFTLFWLHTMAEGTQGFWLHVEILDDEVERRQTMAFLRISLFY